MNKKSLLCLLLALALCLTGFVCATAEEEAVDVKTYQLGDKMDDFTFTAYDGQTYTLSEMLQEKELVLINFWATWCGPCRMEFPYMEEAYQEYKDRIGLVAMAVWEEDDVTTDTLREYAETNGLTFPMGFGVNSLEESFQVQGIPTSVVVDRFGTICFVEAGSQTSTDNFRRLFDVFLGDEYTESVLLPDGVPAKIPDVAPADPAELAAALNAEGSELAFTNPTDEYNWPMVVKTEGDRTYVTTSNTAQSNSTSAVEFAVTAAEDDVLTLDFAISSEASYDFLTITVNGEMVKQYSGIRDWKTFTYAFPGAGDYAVTLAYVKDEASDEGDDAACFDNVCVVSGDEAAELLASLPVYPHAEANTLTLVNEDAKQILINDPSGLLASSFGDATYYVVPGDTANFKATLAESADPDSAIMYSYFDGFSHVLSDCVDGDAYAFSSGIDSMETTGASYCYATLTVGDEVTYVVFFNSEQNVNTFFNRNFTDEDGNPTATWEYADGSAHTTDELAVAPAAEEETPDEAEDAEAEDADEAGDEADETEENETADEGAADETVYYTYGDQLPDFTFTDYDGNEYTLSKLLEEKDMVLINFWATWCGPCRAEFPFMEEAYEEYKDRIEIVAMDVWEDDAVTADTLRDFASENGLTFPMGFSVNKLEDAFMVDGIPTSVVVDKFGTVAFIESGSQPDTDSFRRLFDFFLDENYTESQMLDSVPPAKPTVAPSAEADLATALNVEGGELVFTNPTDEYTWPMVVAEVDGRTALVSSNTGVNGASALVYTTLNAAAGDVLAFDFKTSTEAGFDVLSLTVNDKVIKSFGGVKDWMSYAYAFEKDGEYAVSLGYVKDMAESSNDDVVYIDNVRLLSGEDAAAALAANPVYPVADETAISFDAEDAKEIIILDPTFSLAASFGAYKAYIVPEDTFNMTIALAEDVDPECAFFYDDYTMMQSGAEYGGQPILDYLTDGAYTAPTGTLCVEKNGTDYCYSCIMLYPCSDAELEDLVTVLLFRNEENVNAFLSYYFTDENGEVAASWTYADGTAPTTTEIAQPEEGSDALPEGMAAYTLIFVDTDGNPVPGVIANVCDDEACQPMTADETGTIAFTYPAFAYHVQVIKIPDGYEYDTSKESWLSEEGGMTIFVLNKQ